MFENEKAMQTWWSESLKEVDGISELIINDEEFSSFVPNTLMEKKLYNSFSYCYKSFYINEVISENTNISLKEGDSLKPDFLLYAAETESIVIIELKNDVSPTRQAGTELSAYASEIKSYIPFISEGDIINVIISITWPTLLRHYVFHEIFWLQRNLICLEPIDSEDGIKLRVLDVSSLIEGDLSFKICPQHLGGYQLCLYDNELYKPQHDRSRLDSHVEQMKTALEMIATKGYSHKSHGFAFLWKDHWEISLAPYSISVLNFAPFNSIERLFHSDTEITADLTWKFIDLIKEYSPEGHGQSLIEITKEGISFVNKFCSPRMEGFTTWDNLKDMMYGRAEIIAFRAWGIFGELFSEKLKHKYENGETRVSSVDPNLGMELLDELIDFNYPFINLAYTNYKNEGDFDDEMI